MKTKSFWFGGVALGLLASVGTGGCGSDSSGGMPATGGAGAAGTASGGSAMGGANGGVGVAGHGGSATAGDASTAGSGGSSAAGVSGAGGSGPATDGGATSAAGDGGQAGVTSDAGAGGQGGTPSDAGAGGQGGEGYVAQWDALSALLDSGKKRNYPAAAMASDGEAMVIWSDGRIHASRYTAATWSAKQDIDGTVAAFHASDGPFLGGYAGNQYTAVWSSFGDAPYTVYSAIFNGTSWGARFSLTAANVSGAVDGASFDQSGEGAVLYHDATAFPFPLYVRRHHSGTFDAEESIGSEQANVGASIAVNASGSVAVAWIEPGQNDETLWLRRYVVGDGWQAPQTVATSADGFQTTAVDIDDAGNVLVLGQQDLPDPPTTTDALIARHYSKQANAFSDPFELVRGYLAAFECRLDSRGDALVSWTLSSGASGLRLRSANGTWGATEPIAGTTLYVRLRDYAKDAYRIVYARLPASGTAQDFEAGRYLVGRGLIDVATLEDTPYGDEIPNSLWVLKDGNGVLAWRRRMDYGNVTPDLQIHALLLH